MIAFCVALISLQELQSGALAAHSPSSRREARAQELAEQLEKIDGRIRSAKTVATKFKAATEDLMPEGKLTSRVEGSLHLMSGNRARLSMRLWLGAGGGVMQCRPPFPMEPRATRKELVRPHEVPAQRRHHQRRLACGVRGVHVELRVSHQDVGRVKRRRPQGHVERHLPFLVARIGIEATLQQRAHGSSVVPVDRLEEVFVGTGARRRK